ncbi:MAG: 16S rRNA (cytidine(1402)-2'-O)-methyltransferase [Acidobacteria bacterium]|nr:16S rRNA (cytidine(1402)-2'-O)-methyltransferase [Acidobacteriota bacterium]
MPGILYVVATPIGNLKDITLRALEVLRQVDFVACEDTRVTAGLLRHYGIRKSMVSYHEHNERKRSSELIERLVAGESIALISDAGTPALSDPGATLVSSAAKAGIRTVPVPGPSALSAILSVAGETAEPIVFIGFAPSRAQARQRFLEQIVHRATYCFYESPHRVLSLLRQLETTWGNPAVVMGRELTKLHEEILHGSARDVAAELERRKRLLGEFVLLVQKSDAPPASDAANPELSSRSLHGELERLLAGGQERKAALRQLARSHGLSRRELYRRLLRTADP